MGIDDLVDKATDALHSDNAEQISDNVLNKASAAVDGLTGDTFAERSTRCAIRSTARSTLAK